ncbi:hypothetical protein [Flavobacterium sp.]
MKNFNKLAIILFTGLTLALSSCSSDSSGGGSAGPATGAYIKANVGGNNFLAEGNLAAGTFNESALNIGGSTITGQSLNIQLYGISTLLTKGTYNINATNIGDVYTGGATYSDVNTSNFSVVSYSSINCDNAVGTLEITYIDANKVEGTFSCKGKEVKQDESCDGATININDGSFRIIRSN